MITYVDADGHLRELWLWQMAGQMLAVRPERHVERLSRLQHEAEERRRRGGGMIANDVVTPGG